MKAKSMTQIRHARAADSADTPHRRVADPGGRSRAAGVPGRASGPRSPAGRPTRGRRHAPRSCRRRGAERSRGVGAQPEVVAAPRADAQVLLELLVVEHLAAAGTLRPQVGRVGVAAWTEGQPDGHQMSRSLARHPRQTTRAAPAMDIASDTPEAMAPPARRPRRRARPAGTTAGCDSGRPTARAAPPALGGLPPAARACGPDAGGAQATRQALLEPEPRVEAGQRSRQRVAAVGQQLRLVTAVPRPRACLRQEPVDGRVESSAVRVAHAAPQVSCRDRAEGAVDEDPHGPLQPTHDLRRSRER